MCSDLNFKWIYIDQTTLPKEEPFYHKMNVEWQPNHSWGDWSCLFIRHCLERERERTRCFPPKCACRYHVNVLSFYLILCCVNGALLMWLPIFHSITFFLFSDMRLRMTPAHTTGRIWIETYALNQWQCFWSWLLEQDIYFSIIFSYQFLENVKSCFYGMNILSSLYDVVSFPLNFDFSWYSGGLAVFGIFNFCFMSESFFGFRRPKKLFEDTHFYLYICLSKYV